MTNQFAECLVTFSLIMDDGNSFDPTIFSLDQDDRSFTINTSNQNLDLQNLDMTLEASNQYM